MENLPLGFGNCDNEQRTSVCSVPIVVIVPGWKL